MKVPNLAGFKNSGKLQRTNLKRMRQSIKLRKPNTKDGALGSTLAPDENEINYADYYEGLSNTQIK